MKFPVTLLSFLLFSSAESRPQDFDDVSLQPRQVARPQQYFDSVWAKVERDINTECKTCPYETCPNKEWYGSSYMFRVNCWANGSKINGTDLWLHSEQGCYVTERDTIEYQRNYTEDIKWCGYVPQRNTRRKTTANVNIDCKICPHANCDTVKIFQRRADISVTCRSQEMPVKCFSGCRPTDFEPLRANTTLSWYRTAENCYVPEKSVKSIWRKASMEYCGPVPYLDRNMRAPEPPPLITTTTTVTTTATVTVTTTIIQRPPICTTCAPLIYGYTPPHVAAPTTSSVAPVLPVPPVSAADSPVLPATAVPKFSNGTAAVPPVLPAAALPKFSSSTAAALWSNRTSVGSVSPGLVKTTSSPTFTLIPITSTLSVDPGTSTPSVIIITITSPSLTIITITSPGGPTFTLIPITSTLSVDPGTSAPSLTIIPITSPGGPTFTLIPITSSQTQTPTLTLIPITSTPSTILPTSSPTLTLIPISPKVAQVADSEQIPTLTLWPGSTVSGPETFETVTWEDLAGPAGAATTAATRTTTSRPAFTLDPINVTGGIEPISDIPGSGGGIEPISDIPGTTGGIEPISNIPGTIVSGTGISDIVYSATVTPAMVTVTRTGLGRPPSAQAASSRSSSSQAIPNRPSPSQPAPNRPSPSQPAPNRPSPSQPTSSLPTTKWPTFTLSPISVTGTIDPFAASSALVLNRTSKWPTFTLSPITVTTSLDPFHSVSGTTILGTSLTDIVVQSQETKTWPTLSISPVSAAGILSPTPSLPRANVSSASSASSAPAVASLHTWPTLTLSPITSSNIIEPISSIPGPTISSPLTEIIAENTPIPTPIPQSTRMAVLYSAVCTCAMPICTGDVAQDLCTQRAAASCSSWCAKMTASPSTSVILNDPFMTTTPGRPAPVMAVPTEGAGQEHVGDEYESTTVVVLTQVVSPVPAPMG